MILFRRTGRPDTLPIPAATPEGASSGALCKVGVLNGFVPHPVGNYGSLPYPTAIPSRARASDCRPFGSGVNVTTLIPWRSGTTPWIRTGASQYTVRPAPGVSGAGIPPGRGISRAGATGAAPPSVAAVNQPRVQPIWPNRLSGAWQGWAGRG